MFLKSKIKFTDFDGKSVKTPFYPSAFSLFLNVQGVPY